MDEYIKKEIVVDYLRSKLCSKCQYIEDWTPDECNHCLAPEAIKSIEMTTPADVKPVVRGEWKDYSDRMYPKRHDYHCPKCGERADYFVCGTEDWWCAYEPNFCPNCGADMQPRENLEAGAEYADADTMMPAT